MLLTPLLIACRCERPLNHHTVEKIAHHCQVDVEQVVVVRDMPSIYQVPVLLEEQGLLPLLSEGLKLDAVHLPPACVSHGASVWRKWKGLTMPNQQFFDPVSIVLVGKYTEFHDSYLSVIKSLEHSAMRCRRRLQIVWVDSEHLESGARDSDPAKFHKAWHQVCTADGILVPGGFGLRGTEGMVAAAKWARENKTPYLGICLGMQIAVIEFARNMCGVSGATSEEFPNTGSDNVIIFMPEVDKVNMGGTMRLGRRATHFQKGSEWSKLRALYGGQVDIHERHRHRYEVNPEYVERLEKDGLAFVGKDDTSVRMEVIELKDHPWFVGVQFHPEYLSRVLNPSRPYLGFVAASSGCLNEIMSHVATTNGVVTTPPAVDGLANGVHEIKINGSFNGANGNSHF
jgi:CTP synthase